MDLLSGKRERRRLKLKLRSAGTWFVSSYGEYLNKVHINLLPVFVMDE